MHKIEQSTELLLHQKMLPLYYHENAEVCVEVLQALYNAGIKIVEFTNRGAFALDNFKHLIDAGKNMPGMMIGIGTIKNKKQAKQYIEAGADFIVCPSINKKVAKVTNQAGLLWIPGCMTPTEIAAAEKAGASIVKIFPGNILGPSYITAIKDLFPGIKFMPTGGVEAEENNLKEWFNAGVVAVGMGSKLVSKNLIEKRDYERITQLTKDALFLVSSINQ